MCATVWPTGGQKLIGLFNSVVLVPLPVGRNANVLFPVSVQPGHGGGQRLEAGEGSGLHTAAAGTPLTHKAGGIVPEEQG